MTGNLAENAAADKATQEKMEKRKALGRGLDSLLPSGPRVVAGTAVAPANPAARAATAQSPNSPAFQSVPPGTAASRTEVPAPPPNAATPDTGLQNPPQEGVIAEIHGQAARRAGEEVREIPLDQIDDNPYQTRTYFDKELLFDLKESIEATGVVQPIVVRPENGRYILVLGERRCRASKMAGKTTIPAIVRRVSDQQAAEMTVVENLQRQDLNCLEQATAFSKLSRNFGMTQDEIGKRVGFSRESVSNYMRLLKLPESVQVYLQSGELTFNDARILLQFDGEPETIARLADDAVNKHLTGDGISKLCIDEWVLKQPKEPKLGNARWVDPNVRAIQRNLEETLGVRVRISDRHGKGKIVIEYGTLDDFDRVIEMLGKK
jgi:ParB family transcriptional regulator, chromosome partitioning protein